MNAEEEHNEELLRKLRAYEWPEEKPVPGVMPRRLYEGHRIRDLAYVIHQYALHDRAILQDWLDELMDLCHRHNGRVEELAEQSQEVGVVYSNPE